MADVRNFRKYVQELSGNNLLIKKMAALEKKQKKLEKKIDAMKEDIGLIKKAKAEVLPKKKGRKPRPMIKVIEDEMAAAPGKTMMVRDIVKMLKRKNVKSNAANMYSSVASSLTHNPKFEKAGVGKFRLVGGSAPKAKKTRKKSAKAKKA